MLGFRYVICVISFRIARHEEGGNDEDEKSQGEQTTFLREVLYIDIDIYTRLSSLSLFVPRTLLLRRRARRAIICAQHRCHCYRRCRFSRSLLPSRAMTIPLLSIVPAGRRRRLRLLRRRRRRRDVSARLYLLLLPSPHPPSRVVLFTVLVAREIAGASAKLKRSCTLRYTRLPSRVPT